MEASSIHGRWATAGRVLSSSPGGVRQRGIFPLPVPSIPEAPSAGSISQSVRRRALQSAHVDAWVRDIIISLNAMYLGESDRGNFEASGSVTLSQQLCIERIKSAVLNVGKPPSELTGRGALDELQAKAGYTGEPAQLAPLQLDLLSLPPSGSSPSSFERILHGKAECFLKRLESKVLPDLEAGARLSASNLKAPYNDPIFRSKPRVYAAFCRKLFEAGLVEFRKGCKQQVGAFAVWKKSGKQRLVIDSRLANLHFTVPEKVALCTGSSFARLEVDPGPAVEVGGVDISDAFYQIELPASLRGFFGLSRIRARDVGISSTVEGSVNDETWVYPCLRVVPMGWSHALWICQSFHEILSSEVDGISLDRRLVDKRPVPSLRRKAKDDDHFVHLEYVDNFVALSQRPGVCFEVASRMEKQLNSRGLPTHEVEAGVGLETLGWHFCEDRPWVQVTPKRLWRLRLATGQLLLDGVCTGKTLEKLVGHFTFAGLLRRGYLSIFQASYAFIRKHYTHTYSLWPEVRRELFWAASLICLLGRDLSSEWSKTVYATDASLTGRGVVATERNICDIRDVAQHSDRWKFSPEDENKVVHDHVRMSLLQVDAETLTFTGDEGLSEAVGGGENLQGLSATPISVPEVPLGFIGENWRKIDSGNWERQEAIPVLEGRSLVWACQHLSRRHGCLERSASLLASSPKTRKEHEALGNQSRKKMRAESRAKIHGAAKGMHPDAKSFLEMNAVSVARQKSYTRAMTLFRQFAEDHQIDVTNKQAVDRVATLLLDVMFWDGEDFSAGATLASALVFFREDLQKVSDLPRLASALKGFRKLDPPQARVPLPFPMLCHICLELHKQKLVSICLWLMTIWGTCSRPGESHRIRGSHLVKPSKLCPHWIIILNTGEVEDHKVTSKVGEADEAVLIDQPYLQWLGPALSKRVDKQNPAAPLFNFSMDQGVKAFSQTIASLQYNQASISCVYQIRHGSASTDVLQKMRTLEQVQKRGRWLTPKSVRRYTNGGRISQVFQELSDKGRWEATQAEIEITKTIGPVEWAQAPKGKLG
eukprot:s562_g11.t1